MSDLRIDFTVLDGMRRSLAEVVSRFEELDGRSAAEARIWGDAWVRSAMEEFGGNWKVHRGKLTEQIGKLGESCGATCETFRAVDAALGSMSGGSAR